MDGLGTPVTGVPFVAFTPPSVVRHQTADWSAIRVDNVEGVRHEAFDFILKATSHHLLIANERAEWYDGETFVDGLLKSRARVWNRTLTFVPAGSSTMVGRSHGLCRAPRSSTSTRKVRCCDPSFASLKSNFGHAFAFLIAISGRLHPSSRHRLRIQLKTKAPTSMRSVSHWHTSSCA